MLFAALNGADDSWVVRGAVSSSAEALTGWFASRGQRPASVAYWRLLGWRLDDAGAKALCRHVQSKLTTETLQRLVQMCLFCPTRLSIWMLVEYQHVSLLEYGVQRWIKDSTQNSHLSNPLLCFGRRLGGTVSFAYTTSLASAGVDDRPWKRLHAEEDAVRFHHKHQMSENEPEEEQEDATDLIGRLYQELFRTLTALVDSFLGSSAGQWMLMCNGLSTYDRHEAEYVHVCLRASIQTQTLRLMSPPYFEGLSPLCNVPAYFYLPTCAELGELRRNAEAATNSTALVRTWSADLARDAATRLVHRVGQNVAHLLDQSLALRLRHSQSGEETSPLHSSRHAALVVLMPPLATDAPPILFARFVTPTTADAFPAPINSDPVMDVIVNAVEAPKDASFSNFINESMPQLSILTSDDEAHIVKERLAGGAILASKFAMCAQDAAFKRHTQLRKEAESLHAARIAMHTQQGPRQTMRMLAAQYNVSPEHVETLLKQTHAEIKQQLHETNPSHGDADNNADMKTPSIDPVDDTHAQFDAALQQLMQNGILDRQVLQKGLRELRTATPYALDTWDERMEFAKRMQEQRRCLQGPAYDAISQHVIGIIAAARDEWSSRGTHTVQGNVDPECGLVPMLVTWETRATDLHRLLGGEAASIVRTLERQHVTNLTKLATHGTTKPDATAQTAAAEIKTILRASMRAEKTPGLVQSLE